MRVGRGWGEDGVEGGARVVLRVGRVWGATGNMMGPRIVGLRMG